MTSSKPRGRPPISPDQRRTNPIPIRLSDTEKTTCETAASDAGMELGAWLRDVALAAAKRAERRRAKS